MKKETPLDSNVVSLKSFKDNKMKEVMKRELAEAHYIMNLSATALTHYTKYKPVQDAVFQLKGNLKIMEIYLKSLGK